jgi:hypothetical protein
MSYVKISDPAIMDLAGMQQIINVINQHSDYLNVLINRFGTVITPTWDEKAAQQIYDPATSVIAYGKTPIESDDDNEVGANKTFYDQSVTFDGVTFSQVPHIVATLDNSQGSLSGQLDFMISVHGATTSGFTLRAMRAGVFNDKWTIDNEIRVNWIAIGPR